MRSPKASIITGPRYQSQVGRRICSRPLQTSMSRRMGPLCGAEIAFFYDPFVGFASTLDSIFELPMSLGQLRHYLIRTARGITIEGGRLQDYASPEPKSMHGLMRRNWLGGRGMHAITFRPSRLER